MLIKYKLMKKTYPDKSQPSYLSLYSFNSFLQNQNLKKKKQFLKRRKGEYLISKGVQYT